MKFGEVFWGGVKIDALKGGGDASKRETIIQFSRRRIIKATKGYYR